MPCCRPSPASYSSYRSELAGLHGGLLFLLGLCKAHRIQNGRIIVACDNKGSLQKITRGHVKPQQQHFDYISAISSIIKDLPIQLELRHVKGHKDKLTSIDNLTILESMNVSADLHAKVKASITPSAHFQTKATIYKEWNPITFKLPNGTSTRLYSRLDKTLYELLTTQTSRTYW